MEEFFENITSFIEGKKEYLFLQNKKDRASLPRLLKTIKEPSIFIKTSGSIKQKWVILSKKALFASGASVNTTFEIKEGETWLNTLPPFHVGGLSIFFRAFLNKAKIRPFYEKKWDPFSFVEALDDVTNTSLVPTQVFDLVAASLSPPKSLKRVFVGGAFLPDSLFKKASDLGWPLTRTYGMTETSSQIAFQKETHFELLPHIEAKTTPNKNLQIRSEALFSGYYHEEEKRIEPIQLDEEGFFTTEDRVELKGKNLLFLGREGDFFKIGGETTHLKRLQSLLLEETMKKGLFDSFHLYIKEDARLGATLALAVETLGHPFLEEIVELFNQKVLPFERVRHIEKHPLFKRSPLGKVVAFL